MLTRTRFFISLPYPTQITAEKMRSYWVLILGMVWVLGGCRPQDNFSQLPLRKAPRGDAYYGGFFRYNETEVFRNLFPLSITEVTSHRIGAQIYEGLVKFDQATLRVVPALAERWSVDSQGRLFTFHLRRGVYFHPDPCFNGPPRQVTAYDFKWCLDRLCTPDVLNKGFWIFKDRVRGATLYYESLARGDSVMTGGVPGIRVLDSFTLQIELEQPFAGFLNVLGTPFATVYPREAFERYGARMRIHTVGTGPFILDTVIEDQVVILRRNPNYWRTDSLGNPLPYLDGIMISFVSDQKMEFLEFTRGKLDMIYRMPMEFRKYVFERPNVLSKPYRQFIYQSTPQLATSYYGFLHAKPPFDDIRVRQAFNYAIDRDKLVRFTLKGQAYPASYGFVPPAFATYPATSIEGYSYSPEKANELMKAAGYPQGKGFPPLTLQLNSGGAQNILIAEAIQKMLEDNLHVRVSLNIVPFAAHLEAVETGKVLFWRAGWIADYPDPENFLNLFYGRHVPEQLSQHSYLNTFRYRSSKFDSLFESALRTSNESLRMQRYAQADQQAINDAVCLFLYYYKSDRLLQPYVRNFPINGMEYRDFTAVYLVPSTP